MWLCLLLIAFLTALFWSWLNLIKGTKNTNLGGPFPWPLLGNTLLLAGDASDFLKIFSKLAKKYQDAYQIHILHDRYVVLSHPKYIESVVCSNEILSKSDSYKLLKQWLGRGLLLSSGDRWRIHRKFLTPAFHFNILQTFVPVFVKNGDILTKKLNKIADGATTISLFPIIALATLDVVTESIMGVSFGAQENCNSEYVKAVEEMCGIITSRFRKPLLTLDVLFNLLPSKKRHDDALAIIHKQTYEVINARRQELSKSKKDSLQKDSIDGTKNKNAFLDLLLKAEEDGVIDDESIREEVDTFMFAGYDTTTSAISFTLYCISKHAEVQNKILEEQNSVLGENIIRDPTYSELQQMKYLECVIKESLRLYPPVPIFGRYLTQCANIGGLNIAKYTSVLLNVFEMQRHPDVFEDPLLFKPERFEANMKPFSWLCFSAGPRNCLGQKFAMLEMKVIISSIVKHFKVLPSGIEPELAADITLKSRNGVHIKLLPRTKS